MDRKMILNQILYNNRILRELKKEKAKDDKLLLT